MHEMWFQPSAPAKRPTSSVIATPLEAIKKNSFVRAINLQTLKDVMGAKHPQFRGNLQNDAQEFLRHFISDLHEEMRISKEATFPEFVDTTGMR
jgi:ubiquitin C-terminal hydrolase